MEKQIHVGDGGGSEGLKGEARQEVAQELSGHHGELVATAPTRRCRWTSRSHGARRLQN